MILRYISDRICGDPVEKLNDLLISLKTTPAVGSVKSHPQSRYLITRTISPDCDGIRQSRVKEKRKIWKEDFGQEYQEYSRVWTSSLLCTSSEKTLHFSGCAGYQSRVLLSGPFGSVHLIFAFGSLWTFWFLLVSSEIDL